MNTITLDGREYILRCELNVIELIEARYGSIGAVYEKSGEISCIKFLAAAMINENFYAIGSPERITEGMIGAKMTAADIVPVMREMIAALTECVSPKNV